MTYSEQVLSFEHFDQRISEVYARFVEKLPDKSIEYVQRRFGKYGIFPDLGWSLISFAHSDALEKNDPAPLYEGLSRFIKCAHASKGYPNDKGLYPCGYDFCTLVVPAIYSTLLSKSYLMAAFPCSRKMSKSSYAPYMHAANLLLCLEHPQWPHSEKSLVKSRSFVSAKSTKKLERSFVNIFLGLIDNDSELAATSIKDFGDVYEKSDWGRYKPGTKSTFLHALVACAECYSTSIDKGVLSGLFPKEDLELWSKFRAYRAGIDGDPYRFAGSLEFLNKMEFESGRL